MKIAVCLSGHLRDGDIHTYPSLKKYILDKHDCDIFVSSWIESGKDSDQFSHMDEMTNNSNQDMTQRILDTYKPKKFNIETKDADWAGPLKEKWNNARTRTGARMFQVCCMFKKIHDASLLRKQYEKETGQVYDVVLRHRFDVDIGNDIIETTMPEAISGKIVCKMFSYGMCDLSFWGSPSSMEKICECYLEIPNFVNHDNASSFENAETILKRYVERSEISLCEKNDISLTIIKCNTPEVRRYAR